MNSREYKIFCEIRKKIADNYHNIKKNSSLISNIDLVTSLSKVAYKNNYSKPEITNDFELEINSGRHPIIEQIESEFISNNLKLDNKKFIHTIT
jgi:DNA mismatch repair protein MutS